MTIHDRIKQKRIAAGMTSHKALASAIGVTWQTVQQWENGKTAPNRNRIELVAKALGTSVEFLTTGRLDARQKDVREVKIASPPQTPKNLAYIDYDESRLITLYRESTDRGREAIIISAERAEKRNLVSGILDKV